MTERYDRVADISDREAVTKALARTYGGERDGWERVKEYQRVQAYCAEHPQQGSGAVASALELPRSRIRSWVDSDGKPDPAHAIKTAEARGWLDLAHGETPFVGLNVLVAWVLSGGSINGNWQPSFAVRGDVDRRRLDAAADHVGVDLVAMHADADGRATELRAAADAPLLGRLLAVLGAPVGEKAGQELALPAYLSGAAYQTRLDFTRVYVLNRGTPRRGIPSRPIQVQEERSANYLRSVAGLFRDVVGSEESVWFDGDKQLLLSGRAAGLLCADPVLGDWIRHR